MITHKTILSQGIGWLQVTYMDYKYPASWDAGYEDVGHGRWGYAAMRTFDDGRVVLTGSERLAMGTHVVMSASTLANIYSRYGVSPHDLLMTLSDADRVTRIDVCVDVQRGSLDFDVMDAELVGKQARTKADVAHRFRALNGAGDTIYVGAASSQKRLRIYDKSAEQQLSDMEWTRIELQCRKPVANVLRREIVTRPGDESVIPGAIRGFCDFPEYGTWTRIFDVAPILFSAPKPERDGMFEWLINCAAPSLARYQHQHPEHAALDAFLGAYGEVWKRLEFVRE